MKSIRIILGIALIAGLTLGATAPVTALSSTWGVDQGDIARYYIDSINFSGIEGNLATFFLTESNRTNWVVITHVGSDFVNYTLGLANNTNIIPNQQVRMNQTSLGGVDLILPSGDLPIVLPLSAGGRSNYLEYISTSASLLNSVISSLISTNGNFSFIEDATITSNYGDTLRITANIHLGNFSDISSLISGFNFTAIPTLNQNQTISGGDVSLTVYYNTTDGMLSQFDLTSQLETNSTTADGFDLNTVSFNATIKRTDFIKLIDNTELQSSVSSFVAENPFYWMAGLPALFIMSRRIKNID